MNDCGARPELAWLPIDRITVDARYQRDTGSRRSRNVIAKIAAQFRWPRFGAILVVKAGDCWAVIDGQHRVEACKARGGIDLVPAIVLPHGTVEAAAADFVAINRDRVAVTPLHIHHAMVAAGESRALKIRDVCAAVGVSVCRYPVPANKMKPGETLAAAVIGRAIEIHGADVVTRALRALVEAAGSRAGCIQAPAIRAAVAAISAGVDEHRLAAALTPYTYADLAQMAVDRQEGGAFQSAMNGVFADLAAGRSARPRPPAPAVVESTRPAEPTTGGFREAVNYLRDQDFEVKRAENPREGWQIGDVTGYTPEDIVAFANRMRAGLGRHAYAGGRPHGGAFAGRRPEGE